MRIKKVLQTSTLIIFVVLLSACQSQWQIGILTNGNTAGTILSEEVSFYIDGLEEAEDQIPLAQVLYHHGFALIDHISLLDEELIIQSYPWEEIAQDANITSQGEITINGESYSPTTLEVIPAPLAQEIDLSILDLAPTLAEVLDLPPLPDATGQARSSYAAEQGVLIVVDGMQYQALEKFIAEGSLPFFQSVPEIQLGVTVYPSITTASTAALLTGAPPHVNGVFGYGYRTTELTTLFDHAAEHGLSVTAVEGHSLAFNLRSAEVILSGDRDGDGHTDDNVLANSLEVIQAEMPDLLFIHFHDVDDMGHQFGPNSAEYKDAVTRLDNYLSQIYQTLPSNTFLIISADHGMQDDPRSTGGNHGQLTQSAMTIPIIFLEK